MNPSNGLASSLANALLDTTGSMRTLLPEVFYRNPLPSAVNEVSAEARYIEVNDAWLAFFGLQREQVLGRPLREIQTWASDQERRELRALLAQQPSLRDREMRAKKRSGEEADVLVSWETFDHNGRACMLWVFNDISARKQAERQLRESEKRFEKIVEHSAQAITVTRLADGVYLNVNHAFEVLTGYQRDEVIGRTSVGLGIWQGPGVRDELKRQFAAGQAVASVEARVRMRDGRLIDIFFSATVIELDGEPVLHGTVFDLTQIRQAVQARAASEERFAKVFGASPNPIAIIDRATGIYADANQTWLQLYGYSAEQTRGHTASDLRIWVVPEERLRLIELGRTAGSVRGFEARHRRRDGTLIDVVTTMEPVTLESGPCWIVCVEDVTARRHDERLRRLSDERFARVFRASPSPILIVDSSSGKYVDANSAWLRVYGYSHAEVIGRTSEQLGLWVDPAARQRLLAQCDQTGSVRGFEAQHRTRSGSIIEVISSIEKVTLEHESNWIVCVEDVTLRRREERLRQASEERFAKVFAASPSAILIVHTDTGIYADANQAWLDLYGYTREQVIGRTSAELNTWVNRADRERLLAQPSLRGFETQHRNRAGQIIEVVESVEQIDLDGQMARVICVDDVTAQRRAERERAQLEARLTQVFQVGPHPIVIARASDGSDRRCNNAWHQLFGYRPEEIEGHTSDSLHLWVEPDFRARRQAVLARGDKVRNLETRMRTKSGNIVDVLVSSENVDLDGVTYLVTMLTDVTARKQAERQIEHLATRDYLTGLPNRLLFTDRLRLALARAARDNTRLALLFVDLDQFKNINDTLGHLTGDQLLIEAAARLSAVVRGADSVGRFGGDEFLLMLEGLGAVGDAGAPAQKLVEALAAPFDCNGHVMKVSCSIGISVYPDDARNEEDLLRNADLAMYAAKDAGRNGYRFFTASMNRRLQERMALEQQLRRAVERGQFALHYQPKVSFSTGLVTGCEALLRWHLPGGGMMPPGRFISVAEETGLIVPIGAWVLREACTTLRRWLDAGLVPVPVACNLSAHQFSAALPAQIAAVLRETGVPPGLLDLEITETVMMSNVAMHLDTMRQIKALGVQIALDDFGTGYSSLSYLRNMDFDVLKIDQSFVHDLDSNADARAIVAAIIAMAGKFDMKTVAEGVESPEQAEVLRGMHCDHYQGYLFSQPLPAEQFKTRYLLAA